MIPKTAIPLLVRADTEVKDAIAALCLVATFSHALGEIDRWNEAIDAAAALAKGIARSADSGSENGDGR